MHLFYTNKMLIDADESDLDLKVDYYGQIM